MSEQKANELKHAAFQIYEHLVGNVGHHHWDWEPLAVKAYEAAEAFAKVSEQRLAPQSSTPADQPPAATPDPTPIPTPIPTHAADPAQAAPTGSGLPYAPGQPAGPVGNVGPTGTPGQPGIPG